MNRLLVKTFLWKPTLAWNEVRVLPNFSALAVSLSSKISLVSSGMAASKVVDGTRELERHGTKTQEQGNSLRGTKVT